MKPLSERIRQQIKNHKEVPLDVMGISLSWLGSWADEAEELEEKCASADRLMEAIQRALTEESE